MRKGRKKTRKNRKRTRFLESIVFFSVLCTLFYFTGASAAEKAINKGAKSDKEPLVTEKSPDIPNIPAEQEKHLDNYGYDPSGKIDPFKSFIADQEPIEEKKRRKPKTYLETLELSQLELIAIILSPKGDWGMVRDAKGMGYVIRKGTPIGTNAGVVHEIREKEVIIREMYRAFRGQGKMRDVTKKLHSSQ